MDVSISNEEFDCFRSLIYAESGISLNDSKRALVVARLSKRLRQLELPTFQAYYDHVVAEKDGEEFTQMLDSISTNKTDFFREPKHFEFLRDRILPELQTDRKIRIWSAACSTGEEPYTIAMTLYDGVDSPNRWDCKILASDLSTRVLAKAAAGIYDENQVRDLPSPVLQRHFLKGGGTSAGKVKVKPHLADRVTFRRINLMDDRYPLKTPVDVIFCRNVMIYFDRPTQERLMAKFYRYLSVGGYLFIGHSESLQWVKHRFQYVAPTTYRKET
jgi:chemotaxis protein methyltransferase CheR